MILAHLAQIYAQKTVLWVLPLLDVRHCCNLLLYAISRKKYDPNSRKLWKTSFWAWFRPNGPKYGPPKFFFKNLAASLTRYHGQLLSCKIPEKTNDSVLRKLSDGWMDRQIDWRTQTDRKTDRWKWFYRTLSHWRQASKNKQTLTKSLKL